MTFAHFRRYFNGRLPYMSKKLIHWTIFIVLCIIWGSSFKLMHDSQKGLTASQIAGLRIFAAGLVFLPFAIFNIKKIPRSKIGLVILSAVFGNLLPAYLFAIALMHLDPPVAGILNSLTPICVVIVGIGFFKDKISQQKINGVLVGFIGLVLLTLLPPLMKGENIFSGNMSYSLLIVLATLLYGINVNLVGHYMKGLNAVHVATVSLSFMLIPTSIALWQQGFLDVNFHDVIVQNAILESAGLGIAGTAIATALFYILVKQAGGLFASLVTYGVPFIALLWGIYDHNKITWVQPVCLCIILLGVYMANRPERQKESAL